MAIGAMVTGFWWTSELVWLLEREERASTDVCVRERERERERQMIKKKKK